jgi:Cu-Zn family superoxide dismutase
MEHAVPRVGFFQPKKSDHLEEKMMAKDISMPGRPRHALLALAGLVGLLAAPFNTIAHVHGGPSAQAELEPKSGSGVAGTLLLHERPGKGVHIEGRVTGLAPGKHGFHIHVNGNCDSPDGSSAGGHYAPLGGRHAAPTDKNRHMGDLGNIVANAEGVAELDVMAEGLTLNLMGLNSIAERSLIIHAKEDDFTDPAGNSGARVACGYIDLIEMHMRM